jgi:hypothetical protein
MKDEVSREVMKVVRMAAGKPDNSLQLDKSSVEDESDKEELEGMLYARHAEVESFTDLSKQRGTPIPAMYNQFYKFVSNPSSVSVETFKRMVDTDDTIGAGCDFLTSCLAARMGRYQHKNPEISSWVNERLNEIEGGWLNTVKELLSASWAGFSVAEKVWANTSNGFVPKKIVSLPPQTILFETERTGELTNDGILQYQRNYNPAFSSSGSGYLFGFSGISYSLQSGSAPLRPDMFAKLGDLPFPLRSSNVFNYLSIRIPKLKCIHYSFDAQGKFGNPYGRSLLRRVYKYYVLKDATLQMLGIALDRKGTPLTVVYADPNATIIDPNQVDSVGSARDKRVGVRAQQAARDAFKNVHNDSVIVLPGKKDQYFTVDPVIQQSNAGDFIAALDFYNKGIMRGLLIPSLVFTSGDGSGSFALGQEHAKTFDKILDSLLSGFNQTLIDQLIHEMIAYNFPESSWKKDGLGEFGKRELSIEEREKEIQCFTSAIADGAMDMNDLDDLNKYRDVLDLKPKDKVIVKPDPLNIGGAGDGTDDLDEEDPPVEPKPGEKNGDKKE